MTLQHSPAPWVFDECDFSIVGEHATVATFASDDLPTEADGRLMAAAPDMLRLLRVIADIPLEQARLGIGPKAAIKEARKMLQELDGDT